MSSNKKISLLFLGSTGAGPVYSLEMARALARLGTCELQIVISKKISNLKEWIAQFQDSNVKMDVVETYGHYKLDFILSILKFWRVKKIIRDILSFKPDCLYVPFLLSWDFLLYPKLYKRTRIIATLHDPHLHDKIRNPFLNWISHKNRLAYKYVQDVIILNNRDISFVRDNFCENVHVIPHASFSYYTQNSKDNTYLKYTIGFIGRIEPYKGLDILVDAFLRLDEKYHLLIAGSGKIDNETYKKISSNGRIELYNRYIEDNEFTSLLNKVDFVVLPYKRASQSGVIPLAFAHGKPVVATNVGALQEQVPEGAGIVVDVNVESLVEAISSLYTNPQCIFDYGRRAKIYAETELSWDHSARLLLDIVQSSH